MMPPLEYPAARIVDIEERLAGITMPDPYRWLEGDTEEVREWQTAQATLASGLIRQWPSYGALRKSVARFMTSRGSVTSRSAAGRWFSICPAAEPARSIVVVADSPTEQGTVLFDPASENAQAPPFLSWMNPSPDGRTVAIGLCTDGSENNHIKLVNVASGALLPNPPAQLLMDSWLGGVHWTSDSRGFYFTALSGVAHDFDLHVFYHDLTTGVPAHRIELPHGDKPVEYPVVHNSPDGRWSVAVQGLMAPKPFAILDRGAADGAWRPFVTDIEGSLAGYIVGSNYIAVTNVAAPRGRIVSIPLASPTPNDPASWLTIVPESTAVIRSVRPVGDRLYVSELVNTYARVRIFSDHGEPAGEVPLPGKGAVAEMPFPLMSISQPVEQSGFLFGFSSLTNSHGSYIYRPATESTETLLAPEIVLDDVVIEDRWAISADGTRIPYHIVRLSSIPVDRPQPALLYAYGGFNASLVPQYPGAMASFVAAGGLYVHCHLRGGGELGRDWWEGGRLKAKQNCYLDLYAIAEELIARNATSPDLLAVTGGSNGGLMAAVAAMQRPDLWRVAVPRVPLLDIIGACREPYGRHGVAAELGDPDDPDEVKRMALFSPYQLIEPGRAYPAVYIDAGDTDPRCPAWHSRKFAARLQAAQAGDAPVLVHIWSNVGHGWATPRDIMIEENSEWLGFVMQQLGMKPG